VVERATIAMAAEEVTVMSPSSKGTHVAIVGIGGAGNNLLSHAITRGIDPENCVAVSTDRNQLSGSRAENKVLLNPGEGESQWSRTRLDKVELLAHRVSPFTQQSDFTILLTGLGGVTGTRTAPVIAQLHHSMLRPVVSVVALPFIHERERRFVALRGLKRMVESCDCTVVIDNAVQHKILDNVARTADETAALAVRGLSDSISMSSPIGKKEILNTLALGPVATVCMASIGNMNDVQSAVIDALRTPSSNLPLSQTKGVVMLYRGPQSLSADRAQLAYETVCSLVGKQVEFRYVNSKTNAKPTLSLFLTGYSYGVALEAFVDLIQDLYDMEYGLNPASSSLGLPLRLYQMENA
jgi:cell division GTPase FtsZ